MKKTKSSVYHDRIAETYESDYDSPYWRLYDEITWRNMKKYLPRKRGAAILDVGAGTGHWSIALAKLGFKVTCSDLSKKMLDVARRNAAKEGLGPLIGFVQADITDLRFFGNGAFDMVVAQGDPVGFCDDPGKAVRELSRVAKKGAHVCISIDGFYSTLTDLIAEKRYKKIEQFLETESTEFHSSFPARHFTIDRLPRLLRQGGLETVSIIGKPVFAFGMNQDEIEKLLSDRRLFERVLELEERYNSEPSIIGMSRHIEIVGRKT